MTGIQAFLEILARAGITHLFGNPGTTELPLNAALTQDSRFHYHLGLHEIPVMAMADGYTMASGVPGVVNLHISCGLGNAMGMLYNAFIEGTPLIITAGQQDRRLRLGEPVLEGDLVSVARPWTKWAHEVQRAEDIPQALRRAILTAQTPPTGPVFLSLPIDVQREHLEAFDLSPPNPVDTRVRPPLAALRQAADLLASARHPIVLAGSRVAEADAHAELASLVECLGAPVFTESATTHGRLPCPSNHPHYRGVMPLWSPEIRARLEPFDVLFVVGMPLFRLYIHCQPEGPLPPHLRVIHLDSVFREVGKNHPIEVGLLGDPREGLADLTELLRQRMTEPARTAAEQRCRSLAGERREQTEKLQHAVQEQQGVRPMTPLVFMEALTRNLPAHVAVIEEAVTSHQNYFERMGVLRDPNSFFAHRGWCLGWGMGCALGVKLALPVRPVLALIGDGAALYGIQALWSAAHERLPVVFVIANNAQYRILKACGDVLHYAELYDPKCPGMNLVGPEIDYVGLAQAFGVKACRVTEPEALAEAVRAAFANGEPFLIDAVLSRD